MGDSYLVGAVVSVCVVCDRLIRCRFAPTAARARQAFLRMYEEPGALGPKLMWLMTDHECMALITIVVTVVVMALMA